jgi:hypothetical protein
MRARSDKTLRSAQGVGSLRVLSGLAHSRKRIYSDTYGRQENARYYDLRNDEGEFFAASPQRLVRSRAI